MLIWAMFDCMYKLDQIGASWKEQKRRKEVLNHNPADWILRQKLQISRIQESS
jgi:hypothetical protein